MNLDKFFNPKAIAIVGASAKEGKVGNVLAKNILELGYAGEVFLVNSKHEKLFGRKCFESLAAIGKNIDLAIISLPAKLVNTVVNEGADVVKNFVVVSAGFSETNAEGKEREKELAKIAEEKKLNILGPNCLGFIVPGIKLNASFASGLPQSGNIAFVTQSGALAVAVMDMAKKENMKFSHLVSIGNKMQLSETELLEHFDKDENTKVIGMYLEGIKNGKKFIEAAQKISKPVVILKAGKTEKAQKAISSHTGALAGSLEIMKAAFGKVGVMPAANLEEFFNLINLISLANAPQNSQAIVVTNAGGPGVLATDAFGGKEITLADLKEETKRGLRKILPEESSVENPIDLLGDADEDRYEKVLNLIEQEEEAGSVICILTPQDQTPVDKIAGKIIDFKNKTEKVVVAVFIGGGRIEQAVKNLKSHGIPNFSFPERAVGTLDAYYKRSAWKIGKAEKAGKKLNPERKRAVLDIIREAELQGRSALLFSEAKKIMEMYGVKVVDAYGADAAENVEFPAVVKVDSDKVLHKTDRKGVILGVKNREELNEAVREIKNNFPGENVIVQPMLGKQTELILGIKNDEVFGPVVMYGLGGIYAEIFKMVDFLIPPAEFGEAKEELMKSKINFLFRETRGQKAYDLAELARILVRITELATEIREIKEFDINPLLIYNDGRESVAVDVKIII